EDGHLAPRQAEGVDLIALEHVEFPREAITLDAQIDLALQGLDFGRLGDAAADLAHPLDLGTIAQHPRLAQNLLVRLLAERQLLVRGKREGLGPVARTF